MTKIVRGLILIILAVLVEGCSLDIQLDDLGLQWAPEKTKILVNKKAFADGQEVAHVKMRVFNRAGHHMVGLNIESYFSKSEGNLSFKGCTISNHEGILDCYFTSLIPGRVVTDISDGIENFEISLTFIKKDQDGTFTRISSSKIVQQNASGYDISSGVDFKNTNKEINNGYEIKSRILSK